MKMRKRIRFGRCPQNCGGLAVLASRPVKREGTYEDIKGKPFPRYRHYICSKYGNRHSFTWDVLRNVVE